MQKIVLGSCLVLALLAGQCKSYSPQQLPTEQLRFGYGGGVTGAVHEYILLPNGQLFLTESLMRDTQTLASINRRQAKSYFAQITALANQQIPINSPGNRYQFIQWVVDKDSTDLLRWGNPIAQPPQEVDSLYQQLIQLTVVE